tara:strand:+ start:148 stop:351 length:204 start_codon:yes stop_codon:yes gene_type:complete
MNNFFQFFFNKSLAFSEMNYFALSFVGNSRLDEEGIFASDDSRGLELYTHKQAKEQCNGKHVNIINF